jgi:hypothetical protein
VKGVRREYTELREGGGCNKNDVLLGGHRRNTDELASRPSIGLQQSAQYTLHRVTILSVSDGAGPGKTPANAICG